MPSTDLVQRAESVVAVIDSPAFEQRVAELLPDTVPFRRFTQVAKTAIRANPGLAEADDRSLFGALVLCAQDGLFPDGREAALNVYRTKVRGGGPNGGDVYVKRAQYLPMIGGLRKNLAEYGWTLKTRVVFANDEFSYSEEPQQIRHVPVRPGAPRGERVAAYAVATHRDGRRLQIVLDADDIAKRRAKAQTDNVWNEWPDAMWEKSAGHALFGEIPRAERDRMRVPLEDVAAEEAAAVLYGPNGDAFLASPARGDVPALPPVAGEAVPTPDPGAAAGTSGDGQQVEPPAPAEEPGGSAPDPEADPEPEPAWAKAGTALVPAGAWKDKKLADVAEDEQGREWLGWAVRNKGRFNEPFYQQLELYVRGAHPELIQEGETA